MKNRGFTLTELLVVMAIIGVLVSIILVAMGEAKKSARDVTRKTEMRQLVTAQKMYYGDYDSYFTCSGDAVCTGDCSISGCDTNGWPAKIDIYLRKALSDPGAGTYVWIDNTGDPQVFCAYATLETSPVSYYTASQAGVLECSVVPDITNCCF